MEEQDVEKYIIKILLNRGYALQYDEQIISYGIKYVLQVIKTLVIAIAIEDRANYEEALKLLGGLDKDKATTQLWWDCKNQIY